jgi:sulfonate transport system ATP-binding protein
VSAVRVSGLRRAFASRVVVDGLDLDIRPGEFVALLGRSGSGKTTILRILAGLDMDFGGRVEVTSRVAVAFQEHRLLPWKTVWRNVALGLAGADARDRALRALDEVGLGALADAWPATLSGGEALRAALARALVRQPELLLLDEPFASLDALTRLRAQQLVGRLWEEHRPAVFLITHDVEEALLLADRALVLADGRTRLELPVPLPRPRRTDSPAFLGLRRRLLDALSVL